MTKVKIIKKDAVLSIGLADEINSLKLSQDGRHIVFAGKFRFNSKLNLITGYNSQPAV